MISLYFVFNLRAFEQSKLTYSFYLLLSNTTKFHGTYVNDFLSICFRMYSYRIHPSTLLLGANTILLHREKLITQTRTRQCLSITPCPWVSTVCCCARLAWCLARISTLFVRSNVSTLHLFIYVSESYHSRSLHLDAIHVSP